MPAMRVTPLVFAARQRLQLRFLAQQGWRGVEQGTRLHCGVSLGRKAELRECSKAVARSLATHCPGSSQSISKGARIRRRDSNLGVEKGSADLSLPKVNALLEELLNDSVLVDQRLDAVRSLEQLAANESNSADAAKAAEEALHRALRELSNRTDIQQAVEAALWATWHRSGDDDLDQELRHATALMDKEELEGAIRILSDLISRAPRFAEAWNKRATAHFLRHDYSKSLEDCQKVLQLKPQHFGCLAGMGMCYQGLGQLDAALNSFRQAIRVHPGLEGPRMLIEGLELQTVINERLRPELVRAIEALIDDAHPQAESGTAAVPPAVAAMEHKNQQVGNCLLACDWDVRRICQIASIDEVNSSAEAEEGSQLYMFMVRVRNNVKFGSSSRSSKAGDKLESLARFYALRFDCGRVVPLTRVTKGAMSFHLHPGEEHRFCWQLRVGRSLRDAAGGLLLRSASSTGFDVPDASGNSSFVTAALQPRVPREASPDEIEGLRLGYQFLGTVNLQYLDLDASSPQTSQRKDGE